MECKKRKIDTDKFGSINDFVAALVEDDNRPPDWGLIYSRILYHTGMAYEEISRRTIPQIMAILDGAEENISIKMGIPNIFAGEAPSPTPSGLADKPPSLNQIMAMGSAFNGI